MSYDNIPTRIPKKGFYYHYKHDPKGNFDNYAYEILGIAVHSETEEKTVVYRPLYESSYFAGRDYSGGMDRTADSIAQGVSS